MISEGLSHDTMHAHAALVELRAELRDEQAGLKRSILVRASQVLELHANLPPSRDLADAFEEVRELFLLPPLVTHDGVLTFEQSFRRIDQIDHQLWEIEASIRRLAARRDERTIIVPPNPMFPIAISALVGSLAGAFVTGTIGLLRRRSTVAPGASGVRDSA